MREAEKRMRRIVLIDGENLTYGLRKLLNEDARYDKAPRSVLNGYSFRKLIEELLEDEKPNEILWFGARLRRYDNNDQILAKSEAAIALQAGFVNMLQAQKITFIKVGYLRARESEPCNSCGNSEWNLVEKGVDVGLAVRMLQEANPDTEIVVMSADTDLLPALRAARKMGAKIMHIGYEHQPIAALSTNSDVTRLITKPLAKKCKERG
jgi:uncharacterized LabA/DUF88 family protein